MNGKLQKWDKRTQNFTEGKSHGKGSPARLWLCGSSRRKGRQSMAGAKQLRLPRAAHCSLCFKE